MNAADTIQAAIEKLTALRASSQGGIWYRSVGGVAMYGDEFGSCPEALIYSRSGGRSMHTPQATNADCDLIVTLHRTIDAQLAVLREPLAVYERWNISDAVELEKFPHAYALAKAILGDDS